MAILYLGREGECECEYLNGKALLLRSAGENRRFSLHSLIRQSRGDNGFEPLTVSHSPARPISRSGVFNGGYAPPTCRIALVHHCGALRGIRRTIGMILAMLFF